MELSPVWGLRHWLTSRQKAYAEERQTQLNNRRGFKKKSAENHFRYQRNASARPTLSPSQSVVRFTNLSNGRSCFPTWGERHNGELGTEVSHRSEVKPHRRQCGDYGLAVSGSDTLPHSSKEHSLCWERHSSAPAGSSGEPLYVSKKNKKTPLPLPPVLSPINNTGNFNRCTINTHLKRFIWLATALEHTFLGLLGATWKVQRRSEGLQVSRPV